MSQLPNGGHKEAWASRIGVILAVTGSAVGLGNFLRFPGKAAIYEGGAFMIPYFIALLLLGLPIAWCEWAMGRYGGTRGFNSVPGIFRAVWAKNRFAPYLGALGLLIPVGIYMYYVYIEAWCLSYAFSFAVGDMGMGGDKQTYANYFADFTGATGNGDALQFKGGFLRSGVFFLIICFVLNFVLIYRGLSKGIEWFCKIAMPLLILCALIVLVRVLTLGTPDPSLPERNVVNGLGYMWNPSVQADWVAPSDKPLENLIRAYDTLTVRGTDAPAPAPTAAAEVEVPPPLSIPPEAVAQGEWTVSAPVLTSAMESTGWFEADEGVYRHPKSRVKVILGEGGRVAIASKTFWESLMNAQMWLEAAGQIFFSLSVGFGVIMCYASYLKRRDDVALSSVTAVAGNEFCEVALGGLITIPAAFIFLGAAGAGAAAGSSFDLGFKTLPLVFNTMPLGQFVGFAFFFLLFLAAITSSLSMLQPAIALLEEGLGLDRKASVAMLGILTAVGSGFVVYFSEGLMALDTIDFWVGSFGIYVLATIQVLVFGWVMGIDKGHEELNRGGEIRIPKLVMYVIKYVSPVYLLVVFVMWVSQGAGDYVSALAVNPIAQMSVALVVLLLIFFVIIIARSQKRWDRLEAAQPLAANDAHAPLPETQP